MIQFLLLVSRQGKIRLSKWYAFLPRSQQIKIAQEAANLALSRNRKSCNFIEWREGKLIYKRYARSERRREEKRRDEKQHRQNPKQMISSCRTCCSLAVFVCSFCCTPLPRRHPSNGLSLRLLAPSILNRFHPSESAIRLRLPRIRLPTFHLSSLPPSTDSSLYFIAYTDKDDNELLTLEVIHHYVEILDRYFGNVCELDIIFNFHKAYYLLDETLIAGELQETSKQKVLHASVAQDLMIKAANGQEQ